MTDRENASAPQGDAPALHPGSRDSAAHQASPAQPASAFDFTATRIDGVEQPLSDFRGKVLLIVNTASQCGFVEQYEGLQELQEKFGHRGFTALGFPCNQFLGQEPGTNTEISEFCATRFDVSFPMFEKVHVNGPGAHPLFAWLKSQKSGIAGGRISWNFTKFLIDRTGQVVRRYAPPIPPARIARRVNLELLKHAS